MPPNADLAAADAVLVVHGPDSPALPLVLDSPHSGRRMPPDFASIRSADELREGEDSFIDELYQPATRLGVPLLAAQFPRTYLDANRHADDIDPELLAEPWPGPLFHSGKAAIGKALVWRLLGAERPIYDRKLTVAELQGRIARCHAPYHATLRRLLDAAHARFGVVYHLNCHSMPGTSSRLIEGVDGRPRPDFVLGDRDGSTCRPEFTAFVRDHLAALGYRVTVNDPFKGVELVRAHANPAAGRHSLQLEINKDLYMHTHPIRRNAHFETLQQQLLELLRAVAQAFAPQAAREAGHG